MEPAVINGAWILAARMCRRYGMRGALLRNPFEFNHRNYYRYLLGVSDYGQK